DMGQASVAIFPLFGFILRATTSFAGLNGITGSFFNASSIKRIQMFLAYFVSAVKVSFFPWSYPVQIPAVSWGVKPIIQLSVLVDPDFPAYGRVICLLIASPVTDAYPFKLGSNIPVIIWVSTDMTLGFKICSFVFSCS